MPRLFSHILLLLFCGTQFVDASETPQEPRAIVYPGEERSEFSIDVLKLIFASLPNTQHTVTPHGKWLPRGRDFSLLASNREIDVVWGSATPERESAFLPIRIPIMKGLMGWRIPLVANNNQDVFENIQSLSELKALRPGQGRLWTDKRILEYNGIEVVGANTKTGLFKMLSGNRIDYFPRSITEVWEEYDTYKDFTVSIDEHALIYYPNVSYYYVNKNNTELAKAIRDGFENIIADGSYEAAFREMTESILSRVKPEARKVFKLINPALPKETPLERPELWLNLDVQSVIQK